jgi:hypothetical protein
MIDESSEYEFKSLISSLNTLDAKIKSRKNELGKLQKTAPFNCSTVTIKKPSPQHYSYPVDITKIEQIDSALSIAKTYIAEVRQQFAVIHKKNEEIIESNKVIVERVRSMMNLIGIPTFNITSKFDEAEGEYVQVKEPAGFEKDLSPYTSPFDGYSNAINKLDRMEMDLNTEYRNYKDAIYRKQRDEENQKRAKENLIAFARLQVKYNSEASPEELLDIITKHMYKTKDQDKRKLIEADQLLCHKMITL